MLFGISRVVLAFSLALLLTLAAKAQDNLRRVPPAPHRDSLNSPLTAANKGVVHWDAKPDPCDPGEPIQITAKYPVPLQDDVRIHMPTLPSAYALLVVGRGLRGGCMAIDLTRAKPKGTIESREFQDKPEANAMSPNAKWVTDSDFFGKSLRFWDLEKGAPHKQVALGDRGQIRGVQFVDNDRAVIVRELVRDVEVVVVSASEAKVESTASLALDVNMDFQVSVSPGGRQLALVTDKQLLIYSLRGRKLAEYNLGPFGGAVFPKLQGMAFRHDGKYLAAAWRDRENRRRFICWDMSSGRAMVDTVEESIPVASGDEINREIVNIQMNHLSNAVTWLTDGNTLFIDGFAFVDVVTGRTIGRLPGVAAGPVYGQDSKRLIFPIGGVAFGPRRQLFSYKIPLEELNQTRTELRTTGTISSGESQGRITKADYSRTKKVSVPNVSVPWQVDLKPTDLPPAMTGIRSEDVGLTAVKGKIGVSPVVGFSFLNAGKASIKSYDVSTGTMIGSAVVPNDMELIDVSADGKMALSGKRVDVALTGIRKHQNKVSGWQQVAVWLLAPEKRILAWEPYGQESYPEYRVATGCYFVGRRYALTANYEGKLVLWKFPDCKAIYQIEDFGQILAASSDMRYVFGWQKETDVIRVGDVRSGETVGELHTDEKLVNVHAVAVSPDAERVVAIVTKRGKTLVEWDLRDGEKKREFALPDYILAEASSVAYTDSSHALVAGKYLVALEKKATLWRYSFGDAKHLMQRPGNGYWFVAGANSPRGVELRSVTLPHAAATSLADQVSLQDQTVLRPGMTIRLNVNVTVPKLNEARNLIEKSLVTQGFKLNQNADLILDYRAVERETGETTEYESLTREFGEMQKRTYTVREKAIHIEIVLKDKDGSTIYERQTPVTEWTQLIVRGEPQDVYDEGLRENFRRRLSYRPIPDYLFVDANQLGAGQSGVD